MKNNLNRSVRSFLYISIFLVAGINDSYGQGTLIDFNSIPRSGTVLVYSHLDDDLIWMLPFWRITEKFIGGAMPATPSYRTIISQQQAFLNNNDYNISYESNWYTPWDDVTNTEYSQYYLADNPSYSYMVNDHLEARLFNNPEELSRFEINKIKAKLEQYIANPDMERVITHNNWGEYGHQHHRGLNKAVRELAVKYRKDVWMLGCDNGGFIDVSVPTGITYTFGSFNTPDLYTGIRTIYQNNRLWTWYTDRVPSGNHKFIKIVDRGSDKSYILKGDAITYPGPSQLEPGAYIFDGEDDYMTLKGNNNPAFTISMRIRPDEIRNMDISSMSEFPTSGKNDRNLYLSSNGNISARIYDGNSRVVTSSGTIAADTWSHVAITGNGSSLKLYVNGILENTVNTGTAITNYSTPEFVLGLASVTGSNFSGQINEVRLIDRALSDGEIAEMSHIPFTIASSAGAGGSISPSGTTSFNYGDDRTFTITPGTGYRISDVRVDNKSVGCVTSYTFSNLYSNHTITATFSAITFSLTGSAGPGGSISPQGSITVNYGTNRTFSIIPEEGYNISDVKVDNASVGRITSFTFSNITDDHTISVSFEQITYTITGTSGQGGTIDPGGETAVNHGANFTCSIIPEEGYLVSDVKVDGISVGKITSFTFSNVISNHTISATFTPVLVTVKGSSNPGGSISSSGTTNVKYGTDLVYTITPDVGYEIADVIIDGNSVGPVSTYTFTRIIKDHTISATFRIITFKISGISGDGGSISPAGVVPSVYGSKQTYIITPASGYKILDVVVDGLSVGAVSSYSFEGVTADHTIEVTFKLINTYTINAVAGTGGQITPSGTIVLQEGSDQTYNIIPDKGFRIYEVVVDNQSAGTTSEFSFNDLLSNHKIYATFTTTTVVKAYPNPFAEEINISIACPGENLFDIKVTDMNGRIVYTKNGIAGNTITMLHLRGPSGVYVLRVYSGGNKIATFKLIRI